MIFINPFLENVSGTAFIPIKNAASFAFYISTKVGDYVVDKGDGSALINKTATKNKDFTSVSPTDGDSLNGTFLTYSPAFTGNISVKFLKGLKDVYSVATTKGGSFSSKINITDIETFFKQFPNLYSVFINEFSGSTAVIKGDLAKLPNSVQRVLIEYTAVVNSATDFVLNLSNYDSGSQLKYFNVSRTDSPIKLIGDLNKLPTTCQFFNIQSIHVGSAITYTSGKVWASSFDTLYLPIALTSTETDNLFIDLDNSITTAIGSKIIYLKGFRTSASDSAVASLRAKGFTVTCLRQKLILDLPLQNDFTDYSASPLTIVAGSGSGLPSFVSDGSGGYAVDIASGKYIKTSVNLPINTTNKVTISFDIKTTQTAQADIIGNVVGNFFFMRSNYLFANKLGLADYLGSFNIIHSVSNINSGSWINVKADIDRNLGKDQNSMVLNDVLDFTQNPSYYNDFNGNFGSYPLIIGSSSTVAQLKNIKIFTYENI